MTSTPPPPTGDTEPTWQQPGFDASQDAPLEGPVYSASGAPLVPRPVSPPPSVTETVVTTIGGLVWPVMILLAIMGQIGWWPAMLIALVSSVVLGNVGAHLKARRRALGRGDVGDDQGELR
ncbi:hypothetical protein PROP_02201 [Propionicimonas sp. T2.31MG-18]|uniref:hypothetical protein n=1 Tax=Propionicimonas sp. T2.31MG-18 TaxID=3157620 RepID=UPI0035E6E817